MSDLKESQEAIIHDLLLFLEKNPTPNNSNQFWVNLTMRIQAELGNSWSNGWEEGYDEGWVKAYWDGRD